MRTLLDLDPKGKRVLVRVDYNVPVHDGNVQDETRSLGSLPTLRRLLAGGASPALRSHLGRPKGPDPRYSLAPVGEALRAHLPEARFAPFPPGSEEARREAERMPPRAASVEQSMKAKR